MHEGAGQWGEVNRGFFALKVLKLLYSKFCIYCLPQMSARFKAATYDII